ncbi:MAG: 3D-(3,5/4)-trihydroxycyclohexane-1,2-dione acylhydrolase (decyclizing) [Spirochaetaceae bacterium]|nr:3D-(3,5/4)-trihydroxycyclohexane-1,2-dione acylhydrolase (decyclizing) [Spirochaetaceae bacterium]
MGTERLTMGQALVKYLAAQYSEFDGERRRLIPAIFGIFGHGNVCGLGQALEQGGADLPYHQTRNEQSMVHTAAGFARATLRTQTLACTSSIGPGATNMVTGAATATINRMPVLLLASDYYATRHQGPVLQQLEHPSAADVSVNDCLRPVSRFFDRITRPEQLLTALPQAMRVLTDPAETGAVTLSLPQDVQAHAWDYPSHFFAERTWRIERRPPAAERIEEVVAMLRAARRPVIIAGGGVHYSAAWDVLRAVAAGFGIPVSETHAGKGALRGAPEWSLGGHGVEGTSAAARIAEEADLVLAVGTRMSDFATASQSLFHDPEVRFIAVNVCAADAVKQGALPVVADARLALEALLAAGQGAGVAFSGYRERVAEAQRDWDKIVRTDAYGDHPGEVMSEGQVIEVLNEESQGDDVVVAAAGAPPGNILKLWDGSNGSRCHIEFGFSCMGYELPAGLGVRMAAGGPGSPGEVFVYIGDGTFLLNPMELITALQEQLKVTVVVIDNHGFQVIRRLQMWRTGHAFGNEFRARGGGENGGAPADGGPRLEGDYLPVDIAAIARGMGACAWNAATPEEVRGALREARAETRSCVIVCEVEKHRYVPGADTWWDVAPAEVSRSEVTQTLRSEYERDRAELQRFHY